MGKISEIILHIGLEKTGTTSIQMALDGHKAALHAQGLACSGCLGWYNHKLLAAYGMADGSRDIAVTSAGIDSAPAHQAFRTRTRGHVLAEIDRTDATRYLLTSEDLSRLTSRDDIGRVHALLSEICSNISVIVFLRRQDRLAVSRHCSLLINGNVPPGVFPAPDQAAYYDFAAMLEPWAQVFGDRAIRIVAYPETRSFDAIAAFAAAAGIVLPIDPPGSARHDNASLDIVSQTILQTINRQGSLMTEKASARRLLDAVRAADHGTAGALVSADEARVFHDRYAPGNAALARRFGLAQPLFDEDFSMYPDTAPAPADLAQAALDRMAVVAANLMRRAAHAT